MNWFIVFPFFLKYLVNVEYTINSWPVASEATVMIPDYLRSLLGDCLPTTKFYRHVSLVTPATDPATRDRYACNCTHGHLAVFIIWSQQSFHWPSEAQVCWMTQQISSHCTENIAPPLQDGFLDCSSISFVTTPSDIFRLPGYIFPY